MSADDYGESADNYIPTGESVVESAGSGLESANSSADSTADPLKISVWVLAFIVKIFSSPSRPEIFRLKKINVGPKYRLYGP